MPTRRIMEMTIVTVVLLHPVVGMARIWVRKHLATSTSQTTRSAAEVAGAVL